MAKMTEAQAWQELESHVNMMLCAVKTHNFESVLKQNIAISNPITALMNLREQQDEAAAKAITQAKNTANHKEETHVGSVT